jgi:cytochrome c oxidase assembly protein subunit 11
LSGGQVDKSRSVEVQFLATRNAKLPWDFYPKLKSVTLHPGENKKIEYVAKNNSDHTMTVQAIPSVTPGLAANYLRKTECFCFNQQTLKSGQSMDMPLIFHLDPELPSEYHTVTLSYTLFDAGKYLNKKSKKPVGKIS